MKTLTIRLPESLYQEIEQAAQIRHATISDIVRRRLTQGKKHRSAWDRINHLVTESKKLPRDLSTNPSHMAGYGKNRPD